LPLYRQAQIYVRQGIALDRSTLADWVGRAAWHLRPVHERLLRPLDEYGGLTLAIDSARFFVRVML
jgi:transposase